MKSNNSSPAPEDRKKPGTTRRDGHLPSSALFRRLQFVAKIMETAGTGSGPRIAWRDGRTDVHQYALPADRPLVAGRDPSADICGENGQLSRKHFEVLPGPNGPTLRDLNSRNGTRVNGNPVKEHLLRDGDVIEAGRQVFVFLLK